jgi:hypothetical protein
LNAPAFANTTPRIAFLRYVIAMLESQAWGCCLGQVKTLLSGPELPVAPDVAVPWDIAYFIEHLGSKVPEHAPEFLTALVAALNDPASRDKLDQFEAWRSQAPLALDVPWPD